MQNLKTSVYRLEQKDGREQIKAWDHIRRYLIINDLLQFVKDDKENTNVVDYNYNPNLVDVEYAIVTATEHPKELEIVNAFIKAAGISNIYRTSYSKSKSAKINELNSLTSALRSELKLVDAKKVLIFGPHIGKLFKGEEPLLHEVCDNTLVTSSLIQVLKSDKKTATKIKNVMWNDFKKISITQ